MNFRRFIICSLLACGATETCDQAFAKKVTETVLYSFKGGVDGSGPWSGPVLDKNGNLYGTTLHGESAGLGIVYRIAPDGTETLLHKFTGGTDGSFPYAPVIVDKKGNLFGTTGSGGSGGFGTVFEISTAGIKTEMYGFKGGTDGDSPVGGLVEDKAGNLYGTTFSGGQNGRGTIFKLAPDNKKTTLYNFCSKANCSDGAEPQQTLLLDKKGNFHGTTLDGGSTNCADGCGAVFQLTSGGAETVLYTFCVQRGCPDGSLPSSGLAVDAQGNFFGTTGYGGVTNGNGTLYKVAPDGTGTILYEFAGGADGLHPAGVIVDRKGTIFGAAAGYPDIIYSIPAGGAMTTLYTFQSDGDGQDVVGGLIGLGKKQFTRLYGATYSGGAYNNGTVFEVSLKSKKQ